MHILRKRFFICTALLLPACESEVATGDKTADLEVLPHDDAGLQRLTAVEAEAERSEWEELDVQHLEDLVGVEREDGSDIEAGFGDITAESDAHAAPPACVQLSTWSYRNGVTWYHHAKTTNKCGYPVRIRHVWAYAYDSSCKYIGSGGYYHSSRVRSIVDWFQPYLSSVRSC